MESCKVNIIKFKHKLHAERYVYFQTNEELWSLNDSTSVFIELFSFRYPERIFLTGTGIFMEGYIYKLLYCVGAMIKWWKPEGQLEFAELLIALRDIDKNLWYFLVAFWKSEPWAIGIGQINVSIIYCENLLTLYRKHPWIGTQFKYDIYTCAEEMMIISVFYKTHMLLIQGVEMLLVDESTGYTQFLTQGGPLPGLLHCSMKPSTSLRNSTTLHFLSWHCLRIQY